MALRFAAPIWDSNGQLNTEKPDHMAGSNWNGCAWCALND